MKICPLCESGYHDSHITCPTHGGLLSEIRDLRPGMLIRDTYRIKSKLGKGGMGSVYLAQQTIMDEPRALKFLSQELSEDEAFTSRFLREVRTLRQVRNKNVVDCGDPERAEDGSLFFSMEYVEGPNLRDYLKTAPRPFDVRLALHIARGIAEGLGAAHSKGMVHRDIKPENILMAREGDVWVPKIADFGIVATKETSQQTRTGSALLTMAYAAPEQWTGTRAADLDGRTDLYALGGVLFEMLTGQCVFDAENYHGWAQMHLNHPPAAPSSLRPELKKWKGLDALVLRLLAKDRNDRPQDYAELIKMLDAVVYDPSLAPESAAAYAPTLMQAPTRVSQAPPPSHSGAAVTSGPVASRQEAATSMRVPAAGAGSTGAQAQSRTSSGAPAERRESGGYQTLLQSTRRTTVDSRGSGAHQTVSRTSKGVAVTGSAAAVGKARRGMPAWVWVAGLVVLVGLGFAAQRFYVPKPKFRIFQGQTGPILSVAFSPSGQTIASASSDNTIQLWNVSDGKSLNTIPDHANALAFSPDGRYMASADADKNVRLWDASGQLIATMDGHTDQVLSVAFSPDSRILASGSRDKTIKLWDVAGDKVLNTLVGHTGDVLSVAFSPDGQTLASGSADNTIKLWDVSTVKLLRTLKGHSGPVNSVAFSPDGRTLASGSGDTTIKLWDVSSGKEVRTLQGHTDAVRSVAYSPDGLTLASGSADTTVRLWDAGNGKPGSVLQGGSAAIQSVAFSQDRITLASGSANNSVYLWYLGGAVHN